MLPPALFIGAEALLVGAEELKLGAEALGAEPQGAVLVGEELQGAKAWWINWLLLSKMDADSMAAMIPISTVLYFLNILVIDMYLIYWFVSYFILLWQEYSYLDVKIASI